ncbi:serine/arginine-rich splicing factor 2-like [Amphiura filiformis]|uniref:serine/arginine-rich splicing factor 2-like n=1 Tax=Amphiura filiformis TaxID=82378 RepID=UPI003B2216CB
MSYGRGPPEIEGMTSLKVDNLTFRTTPEELRKAFDKYGEVGDVYIPRDRFTKQSRGFAFIRFYDRRDAEDAMDYMDGKDLDGRELKVQLARYGRPERRPPRPRWGGDRGGGGRYGGGGGYSGGGGRRRRYSRSYSRSRSRSRSRSPRRRRSRSFSRSRSRSRGRQLSRSPQKSRSPSPARRASQSRSRSP